MDLRRYLQRQVHNQSLKERQLYEENALMHGVSIVEATGVTEEARQNELAKRDVEWMLKRKENTQEKGDKNNSEILSEEDFFSDENDNSEENIDSDMEEPRQLKEGESAENPESVHELIDDEAVETAADDNSENAEYDTDLEDFIVGSLPYPKVKKVGKGKQLRVVESDDEPQETRHDTMNPSLVDTQQTLSSETQNFVDTLEVMANKYISTRATVEKIEDLQLPTETQILESEIFPVTSMVAAF